DKNMRSVFIAQLMLRIFYAFMAIYLPIYMHEHIGFSWPEIGVIFTIMVLPFALFELPLGKLADKRYGEKEMLVLGFVITGVSTMFLSMDFGLSIALWALILFITRVGVSMIEIMSETYFFKKINAEDSEIISLFRMIGPASYALVPIIVLLLFFVIDLRFMFVALGLLFIYTIKHVLVIEDTK
ncbi:MFS transporter, partial [Candidatus Pacearchaeota archaeon]|nr:MFS transporter [Candidatus Pacearchaeota archaeon]